MGIRETIQNKKRYISDYAYSVGSVVVLQGVLQVIIYPLINRWQGAEVLGNVVYYMGIVYILCQSVGYALCQTRLVVRKEYETTNGDYNILGAILATAAALVGGAFLAFRISGAELLGVFVILLITTCRFYCSVEYRLKLNFRLCLFFFSVISAGYLIGTVLYFFTGHWYLIFIIGELAGVLYIIFRGSIFKAEPRSENINKLSKAVLTLCCSFLITYSLENLDRIILFNMIDATAVSIYYAVSLVGKTLLMLVGPISMIILSYISADKRKQSRTEFSDAFRIYSVVGIVFYGLCLVGTPIAVRLLYPNLYAHVHGLNMVVNAAQILNMVAAFSITLILNTLGAKWHLRIHAVYALVFLPLSVVCTYYCGIHGYAWAALGAGLVKYILVFWVGYKRFA